MVSALCFTHKCKCKQRVSVYVSQPFMHTKPKLSLTDGTEHLLTAGASLEFVSACLVNPEKRELTIMTYD